MKFLYKNKQTKERIEQIIKNSNYVNLAVAFWGEGSSDVVKKVKDKKIKIICNLESGATNPNEIIKIGQTIGFNNIKSIKNLHAKVYLTDKKLILGSSNFSANGLSLEGEETDKLIEANILIESTEVIRHANQWFNSLWGDARKVDESYCKTFISKWAANRNRRGGGKRKKEINFFKAFENGAYSEEKIYIVVDTIGFTKEEEKIGDREAKAAIKGDMFYMGKKISFWHSYPEIPRDAIIIDYFYGKRGKLYYCRIWKTLPKKYDRKGYQFCYKYDKKLILKRHIDQITLVLKRNAKKLNLPEGSLEMKLSEFYKKFRPLVTTK